MLFKIFIATFLLITVSGCKWMDDIQEQIVDYKIEKEGFHRDYKINTKISSMNRFMDCKLAIKVLIPKGAYIDVVNLDSSLITHCYNSPNLFDVEQPEFSNATREQAIYFYSNKSIRKLFIIEDLLEFPVHLRYHAPSKTESVAIVDFKVPEIFVSCQNNDTVIFNDKNCQRFARKIPCSCGPTKSRCSYMKLNAQPTTAESSITKAEIPIGNSTWANHIITITLVFLILVISLLIKLIHFTLSHPDTPPTSPERRIKTD